MWFFRSAKNAENAAVYGVIDESSQGHDIFARFEGGSEFPATNFRSPETVPSASICVILCLSSSASSPFCDSSPDNSALPATSCSCSSAISAEQACIFFGVASKKNDCNAASASAVLSLPEALLARFYNLSRSSVIATNLVQRPCTDSAPVARWGLAVSHVSPRSENNCRLFSTSVARSRPRCSTRVFFGLSDSTAHPSVFEIPTGSPPTAAWTSLLAQQRLTFDRSSCFQLPLSLPV